MKISCLMPTYNRYPNNGYLVEEAVECFLRQDYKNSELLILNDTPGQTLVFDHPRVVVWNTAERFPDLSAKIQFMIDHAAGDAFVRWDDDDLSLPWRLSLSVKKLRETGAFEWRPKNYWFDDGALKHNHGHQNSHVTAIWTRECLRAIGGYPPKFSGWEDQAFNGRLRDIGKLGGTEMLPLDQIFYCYRWSTGGNHLSGTGGGPADLQNIWDTALKRYPVTPTGRVTITPRWRYNHVERARVASTRNPVRNYTSVQGYFDYQGLYDYAIQHQPRWAKFVEVGCWRGRSLIYLAEQVRKRANRGVVIGVDLGVGAMPYPMPRSNVYAETATLLDNIKACGVQDIATLIVGESTRTAEFFADGSLWMVMLDDDHTRDSVRAGIQAWLPKVMKGGYLCGHDYTNRQFPEVAEAVDDYFGVAQHGLRCSHAPSCWWYRAGMGPLPAAVQKPKLALPPRPAGTPRKLPANHHLRRKPR